jgi:hypothetical protein
MGELTKQKVDAGALVPRDYDLTQVSDALKWVKLSEGTVIEGLLLGKQTIESDDEDDREYYLIRLLRDCPVEYKDENGVKQEDQTASKGDIVAIGKRAKLNWLDALLSEPHLVYICAVKQIKIGHGRTLWTFNGGKRKLDRDSKVPF